MKSDGS